MFVRQTGQTDDTVDHGQVLVVIRNGRLQKWHPEDLFGGTIANGRH